LLICDRPVNCTLKTTGQRVNCELNTTGRGLRAERPAAAGFQSTALEAVLLDTIRRTLDSAAFLENRNH
jgi:hypothetical protein